MEPRITERLQAARNLWVATVRADGRPHLTPVWYVVEGELIYICISPNSVKARNIALNSRVACSLEDGNAPVICEGTAQPVPHPWPETVQRAFKDRFDWDIGSDSDYGLLVEIQPEKWLKWNDAS